MIMSAMGYSGTRGMATLNISSMLDMASEKATPLCDYQSSVWLAKLSSQRRIVFLVDLHVCVRDII